MPRVRLGVAVLVPSPLATEVDALRRALGDPALGRIAPHVTLVPPVNVPVERLDDAVSVLRAAAAATAPLRLRLGPATTFHPVNPVVYLAVGGDVAGLRALRDAVFRPPLERPLTHDFVPHVTVADDLAPERIPAALAALADFVVDVTVDRVHLLREDGGRVWQPIADARFGPVRVIGRGGLPVAIEVGERLPPDAWALLAPAGSVPADGGAGPAGAGVGGGAADVAVVARRGEELAGVATGTALGPVGRLAVLVVAPGARRQGVGRHLLTALTAALRDRGCAALDAVAPAHPAPDGLFGGAGWRPAGDLALPDLTPPDLDPPDPGVDRAPEVGSATDRDVAVRPAGPARWRRWERLLPASPQHAGPG